MVLKSGGVFFQIPLTILACVAASLAIVWLLSQVMGFTMNPSLVAALSAVLSAGVIAVELRGERQG